MVREVRTRDEALLTCGEGVETDVPLSGYVRAESGVPTALWDALLARLPVPICVRARSGHYLQMNPAFAGLLRELNASASRSDKEVFPELIAATFAAEDRECLWRQAPSVALHWFRGPRGRLRVRATRIPFDPVVVLMLEELPGGIVASDQIVVSSAAQALLDALTDVVYLKDAEGVYRAVSQGFAEQVGRPLAEIIGATDDDIWSPKVAARFLAQDAAARARGDEVVHEELVVGPLGLRWLEYRSRPYEGVSQLCGGTIGCARDVSEQKAARERQRALELRLEQTQRLESIGLTAGGLAHDINNLLVGVVGHAELSLRELTMRGDVAMAAERLRDLRAAALQAANLTKQMLTYSGRASSEPQPVDLGEVVAQTLRLIESTLGRNVSFNLELEDGLPAVDGDVAELRQIVLNLFTNAAEAVREAQERRVRVKLCRVPTPSAELHTDGPKAEPAYQLALEVMDSGVGMPSHVVAKMFDPFYSTKPDGRGLGLVAVRSIVRRMGGTIDVESQLGRGTTVRIRLPASIDAAVSVTPLPPSDQPWNSGGELLVVDDQAAVRIVASLLLRDHGFTVHEAATALGALEAFRHNATKLRAVLLDLSLPDAGGEQVLRTMRREAPELPIIVWSGFDEQEARQLIGEDIEYRFVQKPFSMDTLVAQLRGVLDR